MKSPTHELFCPCCGATITVDAETGSILTHVAPPKALLSFEEAALEVKQEKKKAESRFAKAMADRSRQSEILEKKFQKAAEQAAGDDTPPVNPLDLD
jgi:hypothetical protein